MNLLNDITEGIAFLLKGNEKLKTFEIIPTEDKGNVGIAFKKDDFVIFANIADVVLNMKSVEEFNDFMSSFPDLILSAEKKAKEIDEKNIHVRESIKESNDYDVNVYNTLKAYMSCENDNISFTQASYLRNVKMTVVAPENLTEDAVTRYVLGVTIAYSLSNEDKNEMRFITYGDLKKYNLTEKHLYFASLYNALMKSGPIFRDEQNDADINILNKNSNNKSFAYSMSDEEYGSMAFLIPGALNAMNFYLGEDFYFFVADSDKVIIHPKSAFNVERIKEVLKMFPPLSKNLYYYNAKDDEFYIV